MFQRPSQPAWPRDGFRLELSLFGVESGPSRELIIATLPVTTDIRLCGHRAS